MYKKIFVRSLLLLSITLPILVLTGCGSKEKAAAAAEAEAAKGQYYTCGMHPNVIQEGPGNCPICGMKLNPLGGMASTSQTPSAAANGEKKVLYWQAPMDPNYISPKPGKSPMGMDLIPVYEGEEAFGSTVKINPTVEQNIGVRTAIVKKRDITQEIRAVGRVDYNEAKVAHVHTKITGWIEKTYVNTTGQRVKKGEILLDIYSPQLVTAQEEYLDALINLKQASPASKENMKRILASTKRRLEYFDISDAQIEELTRTGEVRKTLSIQSPFSGIVTEKYAIDGMEVKSGMRLYVIADLSEIWVYADIYEYEVPWVKVNQTAIMTLSYEPGKKYVGTVQYIYPYLEEKTRTIKVRLVFDNPKTELKPGMYTNVTIESSPLKDVITIPMEAVLFSGKRNLVFVALGEGRFAPRDVTVGLESGDGYYEIREGLKEGEKIVTSAQFLLDSESRLQESIAKMLSKSKTKTDEKPMSTEENDGSEEKAGMKMDSNKPKSANEDQEQHNGMSGMEHEMSGMKMDSNKPKSANEDQEQHNGMSGMKHEMTGMKMESGATSFGQVKDGKITYYTCPMESHSYVKMPEPGVCPECGMDLVKKTEIYDAAKEYYTCSMPGHSYVVTEKPGDCPVCGMKLVLLKAKTKSQ